ncbi:MAG: hypothetical protein PHU06_13395 [Gallionella sp.]|nr:hypothetical protein [Gallionella sp.]MDD4959787.1 hypothetical protein [Gallionella sp.]
MNVFVSYTRRDGLVTVDLLTVVHARLSKVCTPFIHALEESNLKHQQLAVIRAIFRSHLIVLIVSPAIKQSPWVRLELFLAKLLLRPIISIDVSTVSAWQKEIECEQTG